MTAERALASPDLDLAERCISGDRTAQRELFHRERRHVHATLHRILGTNQHMDDLLQETFIAAFRSLPSFRGEAKLSTWIDRIAVRVAFAHIRARKGMPSLEVVPELRDDDPDAEQRTLAREAARHLYAALDKMDERLRAAFTLHVLDGRPLSEVASIMEATLVATKTRVWRARRALEASAKRDPILAGLLEACGDAGRSA
jgi:RNA polymerase sigma-70 factor, ECF subfamily